MKNNKGITLVALVITIIVMLLLSAVTINAVFGENGVLTNAQKAKIEFEEAALKEQIDMILSDAVNEKFELTDEENERILNDYATDEEREAARQELKLRKYLDYVNQRFDDGNLKAHLQEDVKGLALVYGIHSTKVDYLENKYMKKVSSLGVVEGSTEIWECRERADGKLIVKYNGNETDIKIPNVIDGKLVAELDVDAFRGKNIKSIEFCEGLTGIGKNAFAGCKELETIKNWPDSLITIGDNAFYDCSKMNLQLKFTETLQSVGDNAFYNCNKTVGNAKDILRAGVSYGKGVFKACNNIKGDIGETINSLYGDSYTKIQTNIFYGMTGLTGNLVLCKDVEVIEEYAFADCSGINSIDISQAIKLKRIEKDAFYGCRKMTGEINLKEGFEYLGQAAFQACEKISKVVLPSTLTTCGYRCFHQCKSIKNVEINCENTAFSNGIFEDNIELENAIFGNNCTMTTIPGTFFYNCYKLKNISLPNSVKIIDEAAFQNCTSLEEVVWSTSLETIANKAFQNCNRLRTLPLNSSGNGFIVPLQKIGAAAFMSNYLLGYHSSDNQLPAEGFTKDDIIEGTNTTNIVSLINNSHLGTIGANAFNDCWCLSGSYNTTLSTLAGSVNPGGDAFKNTYVSKSMELITVDINGVAKMNISDPNGKIIGTDEFSNSNTLEKRVYYEDENGDIQSRVETITELEIPEGITKICDNAFKSCKSLTKVTLPSSLTYIGSYVFQYCTNLTTVVNNATNLKTISTALFADCTSLTDPGDWSNVTSIKDSAFSQCKSLKSFEIPSGVTHLTYSFSGSGITKIKVPSTVETMDGYIFSACKDLEELDLSESTITEWKIRLAFGCNKLKKVTLNEGLKAIGQQAFSGCSALETINIPSSVTKIESMAFNECKNLKTVTGATGIVTIDAEAFLNCDNLTSIAGLANTTIIEKSVFAKCVKLTSVGDLDFEKLTKIGGNAFFRTSSLVKSVRVKKGVAEASAFDESGLSVEFIEY